VGPLAPIGRGGRAVAAVARPRGCPVRLRMMPVGNADFVRVEHNEAPAQGIPVLGPFAHPVTSPSAVMGASPPDASPPPASCRAAAAAAKGDRNAAGPRERGSLARPSLCAVGGIAIGADGRCLRRHPSPPRAAVPRGSISTYGSINAYPPPCPGGRRRLPGEKVYRIRRGEASPPVSSARTAPVMQRRRRNWFPGSPPRADHHGHYRTFHAGIFSAFHGC
jgi:hypothetical protein